MGQPKTNRCLSQHQSGVDSSPVIHGSSVQNDDTFCKACLSTTHPTHANSILLGHHCAATSERVLKLLAGCTHCLSKKTNGKWQQQADAEKHLARFFDSTILAAHQAFSLHHLHRPSMTAAPVVWSLVENALLKRAWLANSCLGSHWTLCLSNEKDTHLVRQDTRDLDNHRHNLLPSHLDGDIRIQHMRTGTQTPSLRQSLGPTCDNSQL